MAAENGCTAHFQLFDAAGVGLIGLDKENVVRQANNSFLRYLETDAPAVLGRKAPELREAVTSPEFWDSLADKGSCYALIPGRHHLLLGMTRTYRSEERPELTKIVLLRPYSLEREFMRMRSRLNQHVAFRISEHLASIAVAGEIILQPELQQEETTKNRFLKTFFGDIQDLGGLFSELQEIAEPVPFPNRVHFSRVDYKSLLVDLLAKISGFVGEKNVSISSSLPSGLPPVEGDYHWLSLAIYGALNDVLARTQAMGEVSVVCRTAGKLLETSITLHEGADREDVDWPPPTLFPLIDDEPRTGPMPFTDLAVSRCILQIHGGELDRTGTEEGEQLTVTLPL